MLVLSRKPNESIMIGDDVEIKIVEVKGDYIKLGITAPRHIAVHRKEIYEAIQRENREAAQSQVSDIETLGNILGDGISNLGPQKRPKKKDGNNSND